MIHAQQCWSEKFTVFSTLEKQWKRNEGEMRDNNFKVCVQPNKAQNEIQDDSYFNWARTVLPIPRSYTVYFYDEWKNGRKSMKVLCELKQKNWKPRKFRFNL